MLRLFEFKKILQNFIVPSLAKMQENAKILSDIKAVYQLEQKFTEQLKQLNELRSVLVRKYYFKI